MKLTENEMKLCAYIFREDLEVRYDFFFHGIFFRVYNNNNNLLKFIYCSNELVFSVEDQIGIRSDFHCFIPGGYVRKSV
jgi:hypothetical protein